MLKMFSVVFVLLNILLFSLHADEELRRTADKIYRDALTEYSCVLTDREAEDAAVQLCRLEGLSVKSFEKAAIAMEVLIKGLRAVVEQKRKPDEVYESLQMKKYNISPANWSYYLKKYRTSKAIARLEKWIPNNEQIIIRSLAKNYRRIIERWLLEQKILIISSRSTPNVSDEQKIRSWWKRRVDQQAQISGTDKDVLIGILSRRVPMPKKQAEFWKQHFKHKLNSPADKK
ncbi:MAG: hypothetical protein E7055_08165 [Lentisphaerae bacterium]|nr:hypothetical protein [Lentisphaerota bacterium]